jgi:phosphoenolpyruvate-protein kinase (PTS system EI component)
VIFPLIGGLVADAGGALSHPAIIAREYGVPAVVAAVGATDTLRDGEIVTIDGSEGTVHRRTEHRAVGQRAGEHRDGEHRAGEERERRAPRP